MPPVGRTCDRNSIAKIPRPNKREVKKGAKREEEGIKAAVNRENRQRMGIRSVFLAVWLILVGKILDFWEKTHYQNPEKKVIILDEPW